MNPYRILGVTSRMSLPEIRKVYLKLAKIYHPDGVCGDDKKFKEVNEAWKVIKSCKEKINNTNVGVITHKTLFTFRRVNK